VTKEHVGELVNAATGAGRAGFLVGTGWTLPRPGRIGADQVYGAEFGAGSATDGVSGGDFVASSGLVGAAEPGVVLVRNRGGVRQPLVAVTVVGRSLAARCGVP
jgi:hypothetical protein